MQAIQLHIKEDIIKETQGKKIYYTLTSTQLMWSSELDVEELMDIKRMETREQGIGQRTWYMKTVHKQNRKRKQES